MKRNEDYLLREIAGEYVLVPTGEVSQTLNGMIQLTDTAAFLWRELEAAKDLEDLVDKVVNEYEIDKETAFIDVQGFLGELFVRKMVYDIPEFIEIDEDQE